MRQNSDARFRLALEQAENQLIDQRGLARAARTGEADDLRFTILDSRFSLLLRRLPIGVAVFDRGQLACQLDLRRAGGGAPARLAIVRAHELHHFLERRAGEENLVHPAALHDPLIVPGDRSPAAAENLNLVRPVPLQLPDDFGKKFHVPAVVTGDANGAHIFLDGRAHDVPYVAVIAEINDLDPVADELEIDGVNGAVVPVANGDSGEDADR